MNITAKFPNGVPKISVVWIISMFLIQMATILTMNWFHSQRILVGHLSPTEEFHASNDWATRLCVTVFVESMITLFVAGWISINSRKWNT